MLKQERGVTKLKAHNNVTLYSAAFGFPLTETTELSLNHENPRLKI